MMHSRTWSVDTLSCKPAEACGQFLTWLRQQVQEMGSLPLAMRSYPHSKEPRYLNIDVMWDTDNRAYSLRYYDADGNPAWDTNGGTSWSLWCEPYCERAGGLDQEWPRVMWSDYSDGEYAMTHYGSNPDWEVNHMGGVRWMLSVRVHEPELPNDLYVAVGTDGVWSASYNGPADPEAPGALLHSGPVDPTWGKGIGKAE